MSHPVEFPKVRNFKEIVDSYSKVFVAAEELLLANCIVAEFEFEGLSWGRWSNGNFRICYEGRPAIEAKVSLKIEIAKKLPQFIKAAESEMEKLFQEQPLKNPNVRLRKKHE